MPTPNKKVNKTPDANNYMVVKFNLNYSDSLVLPYQDGLQLMASLQSARAYKEEYGKDSLIYDLKISDIRTGVIGEQEYGESILRNVLLAENSDS